MKIVTEFPRKVVEYPDQGIIMRDGCRLSARIWMPEDAASDPVPAILEMQPYRKRDGTPARDCLTHPYFAGHGYGAIRVDMRGNGDSEGLLYDEYTEQELTDACEVIAWAASQAWCNGKVGMMGLCWGGITSLQVAARQPPALKQLSLTQPLLIAMLMIFTIKGVAYSMRILAGRRPCFLIRHEHLIRSSVAINGARFGSTG
jgi:predicted acyl esterase